MKFKDILKKIGGFANSPLGEVITSVVPGAGVVSKVIGTANSFLGDDEKVDENTPVAELKRKLEGLTPEQRLQLEEKELDLEIVEVQEWTKIMQTITDADSKGNTTRPRIAWGCFLVAAFITILSTVAIFQALWTKGLADAHNVFQLGLGVATMATPFVVVFHRYFGIRTREKENKILAAQGYTISRPESGGLLGKFSRFING